MTQKTPLDTLKSNLERDAPDIARVLYGELAPQAFKNVTKHDHVKNVNDPVWRIVELQPWEAAVLDLPLMQRLRRIRQLGMAHVVYPSAQHSRFEHSLGALAAATQMYDALSRKLNAGIDDRLRKSVRIAALMHDCGHGAFSHVSERVLAADDFWGPQFKAAKLILDSLYKPDLSLGDKDKKPHDNGPTPPPPAAELLSALLILTPQMTDFLASQACGLELNDQIIIAGLVLGRSYGLSAPVGTDQVNLDFVKVLISGDIDADKMDYVARDAYFAGIPIAADVHRLINQLDVIQDRSQKTLEGHEINIAVMAVKPTGVAAVEMFIFTRAYLFDRIYQHPKIRAAESVLERNLSQYLKNLIEDGKSVDDFIRFLFHSGGDDYCIGVLSDAHVSPSAFIDLADRRLPRRVLAISPRTTIGYADKRRNWSAMLRRTWGKMIDDIPANTTMVEDAIASLVGNSVQVIIDMPRKSALKENPELYVRGSRGQLEDIGRHFDAAQFSAAYQNVKKTIWVFSDFEDSAKVAAAAALTFMVKFGIAPSDEGLAAAKINLVDFSAALDEIAATDSGKYKLVVDELRRSRNDGLTLPIRMLMPHLPLGDESEQLLAAEILAARLASSGLTKSNIDDLDAALVVVRWLIEHNLSSAGVTRRKNLSMDEDTFRDEVDQFLRVSAKNEIDPEHETDCADGRADFTLRVFDGKQQVALELKAEARPFADIVKDRLAQPFHYTTDPRYGRVAVLYVRCRDDNARRPVEDFAVYTLTNDRSPMLLICIGQRTTSKPASGLKTSTAKGEKPTQG